MMCIRTVYCDQLKAGNGCQGFYINQNGEEGKTGERQKERECERQCVTGSEG